MGCWRLTGLLYHAELVSHDGERQHVNVGAGWGERVTAGQEEDGGQEDTWGDVLRAFL